MDRRTPSPPESHPESWYIEPDDDAEHDENEREESILSFETQDTPAIRFITELGRQFAVHEDGSEAYLLPSDEREIERMNYKYWILKVLFKNRDYFAPLENPRRILDIGSGSGIWTTEFAKQFPRSKVTGTDVCPIVNHEIPSNVEFIQEDAIKMDWGDEPYSYIHTRMLLGCFEDFKQILRCSYEYLEPGGWMESQEVFSTVYCDDDTLRPDDPLLLWSKMHDEAHMTLRRPLRIANKLKRWYEEAGFVDVHEELFKLPINSWPRDPLWKLLGRLWCRQLVAGLSGLSLRAFNQAFDMSQTEIETSLVSVRRAIQDTSTHSYYKVFVVWGRKPENAPPPTRLPPKKRDSTSTT